MPDSGFLSALEKASSCIDKAVGVLCALAFGAMTLIVLAGVFFRYVLNAPLSWVEETARYLMIWGASCAISLGIRSGEHVGLTILLDSMKSRILRNMLQTLIAAAVLSFLAVLFIYSLSMVKDARYMQTQALGIPMAIPYLAVPVSMAVAAAQLLLTYALTLARGGSVGNDKPANIDI